MFCTSDLCVTGGGGAQLILHRPAGWLNVSAACRPPAQIIEQEGVSEFGFPVDKTGPLMVMLYDISSSTPAEMING